jgi:hypothetical protein
LEVDVKILISIVLAIVLVFTNVAPVWAFCGFYVAKADTKLYNQASQVAIARDGDRTILTMANDYQGDAKDFAMVVPVPTVLRKEEVRVANPAIMERLDAFSAPRLVEYFDSNPCDPPMLYDSMIRPMPSAAPGSPAMKRSSNESRGVTVEAQFNVGEYDILILSAKESGGLEQWLTENGYKIPKGAKDLLKPYIRQKLKFFVAKVNLEKFETSGFTKLRPIQIAYESPRFMLPIRLGMVNAQQAQDLIVYLLSPKGRAEVANYRTVRVPSDVNVPEFVKGEFNDFYKSMFTNSYDRENRNVAFLEYAWNMGNCDPCSADPLSPDELKQAGVFWLEQPIGQNSKRAPGIWGGRRPMPTSSNVFITRMHVRYTRDKFPEDLMFQETNNQDNFQGRYVMQHPYLADTSCDAGKKYRATLPKRFDQEAQTLAKLTGWKIEDIRKKLPKVELADVNWVDRFWGQF